MANNSILAFEATNETSKGGILAAMINRVMAWLEKLSASRKAKQEAARRKEINASFKFEERDGQLYITCHGVAIHQIPGDSEVWEVMDYLNASRDAAAKYETITIK